MFSGDKAHILYMYFRKTFSNTEKKCVSLQTRNGVKDIYFVIYGIISEFTDKGQFQYLTKLKGPQVGKYLYTTQFLLLR